MNELELYYLGSLRERRVELKELRRRLVGDSDPAVGGGATAAAALLCKIAHRLKGTGASYGFPEVSQLAGRLEAMAERLAEVAEAGVADVAPTLATLDDFLVLLDRLLATDGTADSGDRGAGG